MTTKLIKNLYLELNSLRLTSLYFVESNTSYYATPYCSIFGCYHGSESFSPSYTTWYYKQQKAEVIGLSNDVIFMQLEKTVSIPIFPKYNGVSKLLI